MTVRAVGQDVQIVVQYGGRGAFWTLSLDDAVAIGAMIVAACPRPSEEGDDD